MFLAEITSPKILQKLFNFFHVCLFQFKKAKFISKIYQVLLQTYIEYLRGKVEDSQTINHHGKQLEVEDGKVIGISGLGGSKTGELTPVETIKN